MRIPSHPRNGTHVVECALVYPFIFFLILSIIVGGLGVYRYQQMAFLSREASRFLATHGANYCKENQNSSQPSSPTGGTLSIAGGTLPGSKINGTYTVDSNYVINNVIIPQATSLLNTTNINNGGPMTVTINFNSPNNTSWPTSWDTAATSSPAANVPNQQSTVNNTSAMVTNTVSVTISYQWTPELVIWNLAGPINLTSTSVMPMSY